MMHDSLRQLIRALGKRGGPAGGSPSDAQLLERFVRARDGGAFELLMWRHGPMVLGVCRRVLDDAQDAEDAFQTTFLALVRKGGSVARGAALAGWLYQVAFRVSLRIRTARSRREGRATAGVDALAAAPDAAPEDRELRRVLDEEIDRLPARQRHAFVLCCLQGLTGEEAARQLGCAPGTVASRLSRARHALRGRLLRRGLAPAAALVAGLGSDALAAPLGSVLVTSSVRAAVAFATTGIPSAETLTHIEGVLRAMFMHKVRRAAALALVLGVLVAGGLLTHHALQAQPADPVTPPTQAPVVVQSGTKKSMAPFGVQVVKPQRGPVNRTVREDGSVRAFEEVDVYAAVSGVLKNVAVELGTAVKKGQLLAEIDAPLLSLEERVAESAVQQARGQMRETEAAVDAAKAEVSAAKSAVQQREADMAAAETAVRYAKDRLDRFEKLLATGAVDREIAEEARTKAANAAALLTAARAALASARANVEVRQGQVKQAEATRHTTQAKAEAADLALEKARYTLGLTKMVAPFDGVVTRQNAYQGHRVGAVNGAGQLPLLTLQRTDLVRVVVDVDASDALSTQPGTPVDLTIDALPGVRFRGQKVSRTGFSLDPKTQTMRAEIDVPNPNQQLRPGMAVRANLHLPTSPPATLRVPFEAVLQLPAGDVVYVVRDGRAHRTPVRVGHFGNGQIEILSGLQPDDLVVTDPGRLPDGAAAVEVKIGPPQEKGR